MCIDNRTYCPNFQTCRMVTTNDVVASESLKNQYINRYCHSYHNDWEACKRYVTKNALQQCPDFVLPDTELSIDQILDKWDKEIQNS